MLFGRQEVSRIFPSFREFVTDSLATAAALNDAAWAIAPAAVAAIAIVVLARRKIGGITGDVLGAITVVSGVTMLVAATF